MSTINRSKGLCGTTRNPWCGALVVAALAVGTALAGRSAQAQTWSLTTLHRFTGGTEGFFPRTSLLQASDGNLYGTTQEGGPNHNGTVFRIDLAGNLTTIYSFTGGADGAYPTANLIQADDGNLYGTCYLGGINNYGSVFGMDLNGNLKMNYAFSGNDGARPYAGLIQVSKQDPTDHNLYGTTSGAGVNPLGTVFSVTLTGSLTTIHQFVAGSDGGGPQGNLVLASNNFLYGTTAEGSGTVYRLDRAGNNFLTVHHFMNGTDGSVPLCGLIQASDGNLYGTASGETANGVSSIFGMDLDGHITSLYDFTGNADGERPLGGLIQGSDGKLYGTTSNSNPGWGTVFSYIPQSGLSTLYTFTGGADGGSPWAGVIQGADGNLYGTTYYGGDTHLNNGLGYGTVYLLSQNPGLSANIGAPSRDASNNVLVPILLYTGTNGANNVKISSASLGTKKATGLPLNLGNLAPHSQVSATLTFPNPGKSGKTKNLTVVIKYAGGGKLTVTKTITLP